MNSNRTLGIFISVTILIWVLIFALSPQPKYQDSISYQLSPSARSITKGDFEMFVVRVNVFENEENAKALKKNINNYFPAYTEILPYNSDLTAVYVGPFRTREDIDNNIEFIYEISETNSGEIVLWKP